MITSCFTFNIHTLMAFVCTGNIVGKGDMLVTSVFYFPNNDSRSLFPMDY